jgi:ABC-type uncharacterized transport systems, ATPase components
MNNINNGIKMINISKAFFGKNALTDINMTFSEYSIHAIVGENGAGKSTLMNILSGILQPDEGNIYINNNEVKITSPTVASSLGIGMIHQHFMLIPMMTVWQNVILGDEPQKHFQIDKKKALDEITEACSRYGIDIDLHKTVGNMTVGEQQKVEILKVLYRNAKYIILDEPTAVLTPAEIEKLFENIKYLRQMGKTIIFISHKLEEVMQISDEISVLRTGVLRATLATDTTNVNEVVKHMVGREVCFGCRIKNENTGEKVLEIKNIATKRAGFGCELNDLSLDVRAGEILGIAGVDGNGQFELLNTILGIQKTTSGKISLSGKDISKESTPSLRAKRIACIPPDRQTQGLVLQQTILRNALLGCEDMDQFKKGFFISYQKAREVVEDLLKKYDVRLTSLYQSAGGLSGGNQQKVILARECEFKGSELIIAVNPTRGLDIGAMEFVYQMLNKYKMDNKAILLFSTELSEILTLSDRISVIFKGSIVHSMENDNVNIDIIGNYMAGVK